jgi:hypothetical protein
VNSPLSDSSTVEPQWLFRPDLPDTSRDSLTLGEAVVERYSLQSEASSVPRYGFRGVAIESMLIYEVYRRVADKDAEETAKFVVWLPSELERWRGTRAEQAASRASARNIGAIALLEGWLASTDSADDNQSLEKFIRAVDEDRLSDRELFP